MGPKAVELCRTLLDHYRRALRLSGDWDYRTVRRQTILAAIDAAAGPEDPYWGYDPDLQARVAEATTAAEAELLARHGIRWNSDTPPRPRNACPVEEMDGSERQHFAAMLGDLMLRLTRHKAG